MAVIRRAVGNSTSSNIRLSDDKLEDMLPKVGDIIVYNQNCRTPMWGLARCDAEERGCGRVTNTSHPVFIEIEEFKSPNYSCKKILYKTDIYVGLMQYKKVDKAYYCGENGLTWKELDVANF